MLKNDVSAWKVNSNDDFLDRWLLKSQKKPTECLWVLNLNPFWVSAEFFLKKFRLKPCKQDISFSKSIFQLFRKFQVNFPGETKRIQKRSHKSLSFMHFHWKFNFKTIPQTPIPFVHVLLYLKIPFIIGQLALHLSVALKMS